MPAGLSHAATFTVDDSADRIDEVNGDGSCTTDGGGCSLRAAVQEANALAGNDNIVVPAGDYQISGSPNEDAAGDGDLDLDRSPNAPSSESVTITGAGARSTRVVGDGADRVFEGVDFQLTASISGITITGGGGVSQGGGIFNSGILNLTDVTVSGNSANSPSQNNQGGGVFNNRIMNLRNVTIRDNTAVRGLTSPFGPQGGGVFDNGDPTSNLTNVTISGNQLTGAGSQGAGFFHNAGANTTTFANVTIAGNTTPVGTQAGGLYFNTSPTLVNTIVALNRSSDGSVNNCAGGGTPPNSLGHNLEEGTDCRLTGSGDKQNTAPLLGPLADNGGQTDTLALQAGSPAIDAGDSAGTACPAADQRGVSRPQGAACDIGAFELAQAGPPPPGDTTPPVASVVSGPGGVSDDRTPTFSFSSNEAGSSFECSIDGGPFGGCSSPFTTPQLAGGLHTFRVRARDQAGNLGEPASFCFQIAQTLGELNASDPPTLGVDVNVAKLSGVVLIGIPGVAARVAGVGASQKGISFVPLERARQIPVGSFLDTKRGSVRLSSARDSAGAVQTGDFARGLFQVLQSRSRSARGLTDIVLKGGSFARSRCGSPGRSGPRPPRSGAASSAGCARTPTAASAPAGATAPRPCAAPSGRPPTAATAPSPRSPAAASPYATTAAARTSS